MPVFYLLINMLIFTADKLGIRLRQGLAGQAALEMPFCRALIVAALVAHAKGAATISLLQLLQKCSEGACQPGVKSMLSV